MRIGVAMRQCLDCRQVGRWGKDGRCDLHRRAVVRLREANPARRAIKDERYGNALYRQVRSMWQDRFKAGVEVYCARGCGSVLGEFTPWALDHIEGDLRPSCRSCNSGARNRAGEGWSR